MAVLFSKLEGCLLCCNWERAYLVVIEYDRGKRASSDDLGGRGNDDTGWHSRDNT